MARSEHDPPTFRRVSQGVYKQIIERLIQSKRISHDMVGGDLPINGNPPLAAFVTVPGDEIIEQIL